MRNFKSGATRSNNNGKISYMGFRHPLTEWSFGKYMLGHQVQEDGKLRTADNWWKGWDEEISIDSLVRHTEALQAIHAGLYVYQVKIDDKEITIMNNKQLKELEKFRVKKEDCYNAIRFNATAGLLEYLKKC